MERATRLRRYSRKDYSQIVEFPVEIVGRDGQVRRYSYEDSVRLYHRRIRSAPIRYDDSELIEAESQHCRQRIDQLRRSYVERYGWGVLRDGLLGGLLATPLAAEAISFLRRVFPGERPGVAALDLSLVDSGDGDAYWLGGKTVGREFLLYVYRLDELGPPGAREAWRAQLRQLAAAPAAEDVERLFVMHEGPDTAILLAGTGAWDGPLVGSTDPLAEGFLGSEDVDHWALGQRALHEGAVAEAVRLFEAGIEAAPLRKALPQAAALLALLDNQPERAEFSARFGAVAHPTDPRLAYLLAVAVARGGRFAEARAILRALPEGAEADPHVRLLRGLLALRQLRVGSALVDLVVAGRHPLITPAERCRREYLLRAASLAVSLLAALGCLTGVLALSVRGEPSVIALGAGWSLLAGVASVVGAVGLRRKLGRLFAGSSPAEARLVSLEMLPRDRSPDAEN